MLCDRQFCQLPNALFGDDSNKRMRPSNRIFFGILLYHARWQYWLITSMMAADEKAATKVSGKFLQYCLVCQKI
jgi:hypothetical protein